MSKHSDYSATQVLTSSMDSLSDSEHGLSSHLYAAVVSLSTIKQLVFLLLAAVSFCLMTRVTGVVSQVVLMECITS